MISTSSHAFVESIYDAPESPGNEDGVAMRFREVSLPSVDIVDLEPREPQVNDRRLLSNRSQNAFRWIISDFATDPTTLSEKYPSEHSKAISMLLSEEYAQHKIGLSHFRSCLSGIHLANRDLENELQAILDSGLLIHLPNFLDCEKAPVDLTFDSLWIISNIASGSSKSCKEILHSDVLSRLESLLHNPDENLVEKTLWVIGNIIADGAESRDKILLIDGIFDKILCLLRSDFPSIAAQASWVISNIFRVSPESIEELAARAVPAILDSLALNESDHLEITQSRRDLCCALHEITLSLKKDSSIMGILVENGSIQLLVNHIRRFYVTEDREFIFCCLEILGTMFCDSDENIQIGLDCGILTLPFALLTIFMYVPNILQHIIWILSNLMGGNDAQKRFILEYRDSRSDLDILGVLRCLFYFDNELISSEIWWFLENAATGGGFFPLLQTNSVLYHLSHSIQLFPQNEDVTVGISALAKYLCYESKDQLIISKELASSIEPQPLNLVKELIQDLKTQRFAVATIVSAETPLPWDIAEYISHFLIGIS